MASSKVSLPQLMTFPSQQKSMTAPVAGVQRRNMANTLFQAIIRARYSKVKFLLDNGVSLDTKNDKGQNLLVTALYISEKDKRNKMFRFLLRRGADCCEVDTRTGRDVLSWACCLGRPEQVKSVLQAGMGEVNLVHRDRDGKTALHHATLGGHTQVVQLLVDTMYKYRLSVDVSDKEGLTPFIYARRFGHLEIAHILLRQGQASSQQFDSLTYRSADTWAEIGTRERRVHARRDRVRQLAGYKIRGRLPPMERSHQLMGPKPPRKAFEMNTNMKDSEDSAMETDRQSDSNDSKASASKGSSSMDTSEGAKDNAKFGWQGRASDTTANQWGSSRGYKSSLPTLTNKSLDTAFTLWTMTHDTSDNPPTHFVGSEFDNTKSNEYRGQTGGINDMMAVLADQQTASFRKVAKPPTPKTPVHQPPPPKPKVSTLAILFGHDKGYKPRQKKASRKATTSSLMGKPKPGKTMSDLARDRRRKAGGLPLIPTQHSLTAR